MTKRHESRRERLAAARLYLIVDPRAVRERDPCAVVADALAGGVDLVQVRMKGAPPREVADWTRRLLPVCAAAQALCIVNDHAEIAASAGADGVHVGQTDGPVGVARALVGAAALVGVSTHSLSQARVAVEQGADYLGLGAMYPTVTKREPLLIGPQALAQVLAEVRVPVFAIGGITVERIDELTLLGGRRVAVSTAILAAADVIDAAQRMKRRLTDAATRP